MSDADKRAWALYAHPCFLDQVAALDKAVAKLKVAQPKDWMTSAEAKTLAAITRLILDDVPADPADPKYRQGSTLGQKRKHWFRAKFGGGRFRLFFRFSSTQRIIIYAWVNDQDTLRTYGRSTDAYKVFGAMLKSGNPADDWEALKQASRAIKRSTTNVPAPKR